MHPDSQGPHIITTGNPGLEQIVMGVAFCSKGFFFVPCRRLCTHSHHPHYFPIEYLHLTHLHTCLTFPWHFNTWSHVLPAACHASNSVQTACIRICSPYAANVPARFPTPISEHVP